MIYGIAAMVVTGVVGLAALVINMLQKQAYKAGAEANHNAEQAKADEAKERAAVVLSEHRDPGTVDQRLRDGNF